MLSAEDRAALHDLKARYFRLVDTKCWDAFALVFTSDAVLDIPEMKFLARGRDEIVAGVRGALEGVLTIHHGHMGELSRVDATHATGIWAMEDRVYWSPTHSLHGFGHYHERYRVQDGEWRIEHSRLSRLHVESVKVRRYAAAA
jgi:hypothetical protein